MLYPLSKLSQNCNNHERFCLLKIRLFLYTKEAISGIILNIKLLYRTVLGC